MLRCSFTPYLFLALGLLLAPRMSNAICVEHECRLTPTLATCEEVDDGSWPGDQYFSFTGICTFTCTSDGTQDVTLEELTLDTLEMLDVSDREPHRVIGQFVELDRVCDDERLIRFDRQLVPGHSYLVRWSGRQMAYFVVRQPAREASDAVHAQPMQRPRHRPSSRLGSRRPDWDHDRSGLGWSIGAAGSLYITEPPDEELLILLGGTISFGLRHLREFNPNGLLEHSESLAGLAPFISLVPPAAFLLPVGSIIGNDIGFDLTITIHAPVNPQEPGLWIALGLRPYFRVSRDAMINSGSTLELFIPEIGVEWAADHLQSFYALWTFLPVSIRFRERFALGIDPVRAGINVDLGDGTITSRFLIGLSAQFL